MTITCPSPMVMYMLPMMLGRTFDIQTNKAGIDIFRQADLKSTDVEEYPQHTVHSKYSIITNSKDKRDFLDISGDLALKISSGLVEVKGAGEYLRDNSNSSNTVELLIKMNFQTILEAIPKDKKPMDASDGSKWQSLEKDYVGTHVVTSMLYGGEVFASVKFIAHKQEYLENITGEVHLAFSKSDAFNVSATGKLEKVAHNVSSKARMEITYFANVPLVDVPSTLEGLKKLVAGFGDQVKKSHINERNRVGTGVAICAGLTPLSDYGYGHSFNLNKDFKDIPNAMDDFNLRFENLREAKTRLKEYVTTIPDNYQIKEMKNLIAFSKTLDKVLCEFHKTIGNLDLEKGKEQFTNAISVFNDGLPDKYRDTNGYTMWMRNLKETERIPDDTTSPRGVYVRWGRLDCGVKQGSFLYSGVIASFPERGVGGGTTYHCISSQPQMSTNLHAAAGADGRESRLSAVQYNHLWMYPQKGYGLNGRAAACSVCQSLMRPTVRTFVAAQKCPEGWTQEYQGYVASTYRSRSRMEFICLDGHVNTTTTKSLDDRYQPYIMPIQVGSRGLESEWAQHKDDSVPCVVCSK